MDELKLKQKLGQNLTGEDPDAQFTTVIFCAYTTIVSNTKMTVRKLKALLCVEYLIKESVVDAAVASLISRSIFASISRWRDPEKPIADMALSAVKPVPETFAKWLSQVVIDYPELTMFEPPIYHHKD